MREGRCDEGERRKEKSKKSQEEEAQGYIEASRTFYLSSLCPLPCKRQSFLNSEGQKGNKIESEFEQDEGFLCVLSESPDANTLQHP